MSLLLFYVLKRIQCSSTCPFSFNINLYLCVETHVYGICRYDAVFAAFVADMASLAGIDFGARFMASLAQSFEVLSM